MWETAERGVEADRQADDPKVSRRSTWLRPVGDDRSWLLGGVERPRRVVRFARLMHRRVRAFGLAFGRRRRSCYSA
jgi:hypothetical protein